jgi:lipopolysaccharide biosynthesis glycosyltransferase
MKICIISACTEDYYYRLYTLYLGLRKYYKNIYFHAHLINMEKNNNLEKVNDKYLSISYSNLETEDKDVIKNYATNIRAKLLAESISNYDKLFWFDADTIIRSKLSELFQILDKYTITIYCNNSSLKSIINKGRYKGGIIGLKKCDIIIKILNEWELETFKNGIYKCYWFQDQLIISKLILKYRNFLYIYNLPKKFIDWDFNEKSPIWVGKGNRKNEEKYLLEEKKISNSI